MYAILILSLVLCGCETWRVTCSWAQAVEDIWASEAGGNSVMGSFVICSLRKILRDEIKDYEMSTACGTRGVEGKST